LDRFIIDPKAGKVINQRSLGVKKSEFPVVADPKVGENWRYSFLALVDPNVDKNQETVGQIGKYDHKTDSFVVSKLGNNLFPSEPILANGNEDPESGHILSVVFNAEENRSEVWVFDSEHIDQEPICVIPLPEIIPPGFHGRWTPKAFNLPLK
jgi:carotenoid cleavage dioxygenase-like enzyme